MPFKSTAQARYMFLKHPEIAHRWAKQTKNFAELPDHVPKVKTPEGLTHERRMAAMQRLASTEGTV